VCRPLTRAGGQAGANRRPSGRALAGGGRGLALLRSSSPGRRRAGPGQEGLGLGLMGGEGVHRVTFRICGRQARDLARRSHEAPTASAGCAAVRAL
jgi:hypothetical protein